MNRRDFFKLVAGAAALVAVPSITSADVPIIWADGIHDDAPGLNALIAGKPVAFAGPSVARSVFVNGDDVYLGGHDFRICSPLQCGDRNLIGNGSGKVSVSANFVGETLADFQVNTLRLPDNLSGLAA